MSIRLNYIYQMNSFISLNKKYKIRILKNNENKITKYNSMKDTTF